MKAKDKEKLELFRKFIESNFYLSTSGELVYMWKDVCSPCFDKDIIEIGKKENWSLTI